MNGSSARLIVVFAAASLAAVGVGAMVAAASGVPAALWARNLAAWALGGLIAAGFAAAARPRALPFLLWAAPAGLLAALAAPGQQGVRRWVDLGPLHMNAAMLVLPAAVVAMAMPAGPRRWPWIAVFLALALLVAQPDASQATTLAAVVALLAALAAGPPALRAGAILAAGVLAALAWRRPDPLRPVPEVEGIIGLAQDLSPLAAGLAWLALLAVAATPAALTIRGAPDLRHAGLALSLCLLLWTLTPLLGAFPVPFVGMGLSPILGAWLGVGVLAGCLRRGSGAQDSGAA